MVCERCGRESETAFKFCPECGAPAPEAGGFREQRKTVTVVFCDVTGSTALGEALDPETLRRVMARYFETMSAAIERHGGTVEKFIGDAVMAVFGIPQLHEDDAARAVRAAAEMQRGLRELNIELDREFGTRLEARIGVNTGEVVTGTSERLATGDAVNVAARLEQAASPGEVLLGEQTAALVREVADLDELEPLALKGKARDVRAYRLVDVREDVARRHRFGRVLVGRARELRRLRDAYEQACSDRAPQLFTVLGSAGIGKSRLVHEFISGAQDATVVAGRCLPYGDGITYWALVEVVKQLTGKGVAEITDGPLATLLRRSADPTTPEAIAVAVRTLFENAAREKPLVVVFDDIHWAEPTLLSLIEHVADLGRDVPLLMLCMARPELREVRPNWGGGALNSTTVMLEPLPPAEVEDLISLLSDASVDEALSRRIAERAEGNPLFVEEMLELVTEQGEDAQVPASIQALLAARLDHLGPVERSVLARAAIEGQVFHAEAVRALRADGGDVDETLLGLVRKDLVRPARAVFGDGAAYRFRHLLIRDAAYSALAKADRAELHERFARWIDDAGTSLVERDELVAYHLEQAYRYRRELGRSDPSTEALATEAASRFTDAAIAALDRADAAAAAALRLRAIDLYGPDSRDAHSLRIARAAVLVELGRFEEARGEIECAAAWADAHSDARMRAHADLRSVALQAFWDPDFAAEPAVEQVKQLIPVFEAERDDAGLAEAFETQARLTSWLGRWAEADGLYTRAIEYAERAGERRRRIVAYSWLLGVKRNGPTPVADAIAFLDAIPDDLQGQLQWNSDRMRAALEAMRGNSDLARTLVADVRERARKAGTMFPQVWALATSTHVEMWEEDWRAAEAYVREALALLEPAGESAVRASMKAVLALLLARQRRFDEAETVLADESFGRRPDFDADTRAWLARALICLARGDHTEAEHHAREVLAIVEHTDELERLAEARVVLAEILAAAGRSTEARTALVEAEEIFARRGATVGVARARAALDALERETEWAG